MMKYPRIPHVPFSHVYDPDDIISKSDIFGREWFITEKIDGSQVGFQFIDGVPDVRNRNTDILHGGADRQYHPFPAWFQSRYDAMWNLLGNEWILFGEWMFHVHTARYNELPDLFIAFDILDKTSGRFLPFDVAMDLASRAGLATVPVIARTVVRDEKHLLSFIGKSAFGDDEMEGIVLHSIDGQEHVKYVTKKFKESIEHAPVHWRWNPVRSKNILRTKNENAATGNKKRKEGRECEWRR